MKTNHFCPLCGCREKPPTAELCGVCQRQVERGEKSVEAGVRMKDMSILEASDVLAYLKNLKRLGREWVKR
jgi:hypothetical protein